MEFEPTTPSMGTVDEATRIAASNRQLTMNPVHGDVIPEDEPDDLIANRHIIGPPIGNIASDSEVTVVAVQTAQEKANHHIALITSTIVMLIVGAITVYSFLSR